MVKDMVKVDYADPPVSVYMLVGFFLAYIVVTAYGDMHDDAINSTIQPMVYLVCLDRFLVNVLRTNAMR